VTDERTITAALAPEGLTPPPAVNAEDDALNVGAGSESELEVRSESERIISVRIAKWGQVADTPIGLETFLPGSLSGVDPRTVVLRLEHEGPPAGRGIGAAVEERADGAYMDFKTSKTPRGDEILTLAMDGVTRFVSPSYKPATSLAEVRQMNGRRVTALVKADVREVSTTWKPYYLGNAVMQVRSEDEQERGQIVPDATAAESANGAPADMGAVLAALGKLGEGQDAIGGRLKDLEERARQEITIPSKVPQLSGDAANMPAAKPLIHHWMDSALKLLRGERVSQRELEERALADVLTTDAPGVVPDAFLNDVIGVIQPMRPFLESTRQIPAPPSGMSITVPVLGTRATVGVQDPEKEDINSTKPTVTTTSFDALSIFGGADVSIQLIRRSSPEFLDLLIRELAEAYAAEADNQAIDALIAAGPTTGTGSLDPEALKLGEAWSNSLTIMKKPPTHIWLASNAVQAFMDAKADGTNAPLYGTLAADFSVANGVGGRIQGLIPVYVPALDDEAVDVIVGPRDGFAWAEDGTFTLQVDVPSKAGRDVALGGILFLMPRYPDAFTTWALAS